MWILQLNDMRSPQIEIMTAVCKAETKEDLEALIEVEKVEFYRDGNWGKNYKKGSILEWFNPPGSIYRHFINFGTESQHQANAATHYHSTLDQIPTAEIAKASI